MGAPGHVEIPHRRRAPWHAFDADTGGLCVLDGLLADIELAGVDQEVILILVRLMRHLDRQPDLVGVDEHMVQRRPLHPAGAHAPDPDAARRLEMADIEQPEIGIVGMFQHQAILAVRSGRLEADVLDPGKQRLARHRAQQPSFPVLALTETAADTDRRTVRQHDLAAAMRLPDQAGAVGQDREVLFGCKAAPWYLQAATRLFVQPRKGSEQRLRIVLSASPRAHMGEIDVAFVFLEPLAVARLPPPASRKEGARPGTAQVVTTAHPRRIIARTCETSRLHRQRSARQFREGKARYAGAARCGRYFATRRSAGCRRQPAVGRQGPASQQSETIASV